MGASVDRSSFEAYRRQHPDLSETIVIRRLCERLLAEAEAEPPIPVERVASMRGISDIYEREQPWAGVLEPRERSFVVWVRTSDGYERQRFTICHEAGHTFFKGFAEGRQFRCNGKRTVLEQRCDVAASELLLPYRFFVEDLEEAGFSLRSVNKLTTVYDASVESTALRVVDLWGGPAALLVLRERHKPVERGREAECEPKLRLDYAHTQGEWPYFLRDKSVGEETPFGRAFCGELVSEVGELGVVATDDVGPVEIHARRYGANGRVLALVRPAPGQKDGVRHT